jgi:hypothetical protein
MLAGTKLALDSWKGTDANLKWICIGIRINRLILRFAAPICEEIQ